MNEYRHTEQHDDRLRERQQELTAIDHDWQTEARRQAVKHELACIVFEQCERYRETHVADNLVEDIDDISARTQLELEIEASYEARYEEQS